MLLLDDHQPESGSLLMYLKHELSTTIGPVITYMVRQKKVAP